MHHPMRRYKQCLPEEAAKALLRTATHGVLALCGDDGMPYAVPLSFAFEGDMLYFHCAPTGHKLELLAQNKNVSFCVVGRDDIEPQRFTTLYESAIAFGTAALVTDDATKRHGLKLLAQKYSPGLEQEGQEEIASSWNRVSVLAMKIERLTGKASRELVE